MPSRPKTDHVDPCRQRSHYCASFVGMTDTNVYGPDPNPSIAPQPWILQPRCGIAHSAPTTVPFLSTSPTQHVGRDFDETTYAQEPTPISPSSSSLSKTWTLQLSDCTSFSSGILLEHPDAHFPDWGWGLGACLFIVRQLDNRKQTDGSSSTAKAEPCWRQILQVLARPEEPTLHRSSQLSQRVSAQVRYGPWNKPVFGFEMTSCR